MFARSCACAYALLCFFSWFLALGGGFRSLDQQIKTLDSDMQTLVYENYNKFISATDTIRKMKSKVRQVTRAPPLTSHEPPHLTSHEPPILTPRHDHGSCRCFALLQRSLELRDLGGSARRGCRRRLRPPWPEPQIKRAR